MLNLTGAGDSSPGLEGSSSSFGVEEAANVIVGAGGDSGISGLGIPDSSLGFRRTEEGGGGCDDDGGEGGEGEGEEEGEGLKISASSLSRLQLSPAI